MNSTPTDAAPPSSTVSLDDKYRLRSGRVFISGTQALVRLTVTQFLRDRQRGLRTAGYVTGYRGSPLGGLDQQMVRAAAELAAHDVHFHPAVNEELAATAVWGAQQAEAAGEGAYDGVFAMWYGKGPGVDRSGDAFRHGNLAGSSKHGGVLVLMGDDHTCESSTTCHQSEFALVDAMIPILSPAGVQEILDFGVLGWSLSRYSGCWVGMKCVKDTVESTASIDVDIDRMQVVEPPLAGPTDGLNLRQPDTPHAQEARLHRHKIEAVKAFARANAFDRVVEPAPDAIMGIATHGKSYLDVLQALHELGLTPQSAAALGVRLYKVGMTWPLEPNGAKSFAAGLKKIVVVEEKRSLVETQLKELLYGEAGAPQIVGKRDERGETLFQSEMALDPVQIAIAIGERMVASLADTPASLPSRIDELRTRRAPRGVVDVVSRSFYFCSGCPHNTSTVIPEGSKAYAGIGCHWMAQAMNRSTTGYTQMGGEGAAWMGESRFSRRKHMFQNMGDGTYFHSGLLAIRAAIAAKTNITYKILYNDAVAMTGGQRHDGQLDGPAIAHQLRAEGIERIAIVAEEPAKYSGAALPPRVSVHPREDLNPVQEELREVEGASALIFDQTCAAEKRRRRKRGLLPEATTRVFINDLVCEGCGDCGVKSNCVSIHPLETEFGRKRTIDQSSCNGDVSCVRGFCPSFVTVTGEMRKARTAASPAADAGEALPDPVYLRTNDGTCSILVAGMGGTGVVTVGAVLGMAAHLDGLGCGILDMAGLAQKGGSVWTHIRIAPSPDSIAAIRIAPGGADVVLGCDQVVAANSKTLTLARAGARVVVNTAEVMPGAFALDGNMAYPRAAFRSNVESVAGEGNVERLDATRLAVALLGDAVYANLFLVGVAFQRGLVPVSAASIVKAIELNGAAVDANRAAFAWGRKWAVDPGLCERAARASAPALRPMLSHEPVEDLDRAIALRRDFLVAYQDRAYADRYLALVEEVRAVERGLGTGRTELTNATARSYFKLLAVKDEYEVARLHVETGFVDAVRSQFEGDARIAFHMAPPIFGTRLSRSGEPRKMKFGAWIMPVLRGLAKLRFLRGGALDPFRHSAERRVDREVLAQYESDVRATLLVLRAPEGRSKYDVAVGLASLPSEIRGYGDVRMRSIERVRAHAHTLRTKLEAPAEARLTPASSPPA